MKEEKQEPIGAVLTDADGWILTDEKIDAVLTDADIREEENGRI